MLLNFRVYTSDNFIIAQKQKKEGFFNIGKNHALCTHSPILCLPETVDTSLYATRSVAALPSALAVIYVRAQVHVPSGATVHMWPYVRGTTL